MLFQRTPIFLNYGDTQHGGHAYFPLDGSTNYRRIMILSAVPDKAPVELEGAAPVTDQPETLLKFAVYDYHTPKTVRRMEPVRVSLKKNLTKNDFVYDDEGKPIKYKPEVVYILEQPVEAQEYSSTPITDPNVVSQLQEWLEQNLMPGQERLTTI